jgi:membrane protein implicated in regulation of membrane protease activity
MAMLALYWFALALIALAIEAFSRQLVLLFVALAALVAGGMAELGLSLPLQFVIFAAASIALPLLFRRPLLARFAGHGVPSRTDDLLGETAVVVEAIDPVRHTGRVSLHGQDWMARAAVPVASGRITTVIGADGIVLLVEPAEHTSLS